MNTQLELYDHKNIFMSSFKINHLKNISSIIFILKHIDSHHPSQTLASMKKRMKK